MGCHIAWALDTGVANSDKEIGALKQSMSGWPLVWRHRVSLGTWQRPGETKEQRVSQVLWVGPKH